MGENGGALARRRFSTWKCNGSKLWWKNFAFLEFCVINVLLVYWTLSVLKELSPLKLLECYSSLFFSPFELLRMCENTFSLSCRKLCCHNTSKTLCQRCNKKNKDRYFLKCFTMPTHFFAYVFFIIILRIWFFSGPESQLGDLHPTMLKFEYTSVPLAQT